MDIATNRHVKKSFLVFSYFPENITFWRRSCLIMKCLVCYISVQTDCPYSRSPCRYHTYLHHCGYWLPLQCCAGHTSLLQRITERCSAVQCSAVQCSAVHCTAVQCTSVYYSAVSYSAVKWHEQCSVEYTVHSTS